MKVLARQFFQKNIVYNSELWFLIENFLLDLRENNKESITYLKRVETWVEFRNIGQINFWDWQYKLYCSGGSGSSYCCFFLFFFGWEEKVTAPAHQQIWFLFAKSQRARPRTCCFLGTHWTNYPWGFFLIFR